MRILTSMLTALALGACLDTEPVDLGDATRDASDGTPEGDSDTTASTPDASATPDAAPDGATPDAAPDGSAPTPCLTLSPAALEFVADIGELTASTATLLNCGDTAIDITHIAFAPDGATTFVLDPITLPVDLAPGATMPIRVSYVPTLISLIGPNLPDKAEVVVANSAIGDLHLPLVGYASGTPCPNAVITSLEGEEVIPQTRLHLDGAQSSSDAYAQITRYEWTVDQPVGSTSVFLPSSVVPSPTFEANVAGVYTFRLTVSDEFGVASCAPAEYTVYVNGTDTLHIELLWNTPGDPDQTDGVGADLDLHFLHPHATGYFDSVFDTYWQSPIPNWGVANPAANDNPRLDRDDTDGAGPENLNFNTPEDGARYCVGVHYWDDHEFGVSNATLRIYLYANLVFEQTDVALVQDDLWEVTCFTWPTGPEGFELLRDEAGAMRITHDYINPLTSP